MTFEKAKVCVRTAGNDARLCENEDWLGGREWGMGYDYVLLIKIGSESDRDLWMFEGFDLYNPHNIWFLFQTCIRIPWHVPVSYFIFSGSTSRVDVKSLNAKQICMCKIRAKLLLPTATLPTMLELRILPMNVLFTHESELQVRQNRGFRLTENEG